MTRGSGCITSNQAPDFAQAGLQLHVPDPEAPRPARSASQLRDRHTASLALRRTPTSTASHLLWLCCRRLEIPGNFMLHSSVVTSGGAMERGSESREQARCPPQRPPAVPSARHVSAQRDSRGRGAARPVRTGLGETSMCFGHEGTTPAF